MIRIMSSWIVGFVLVAGCGMASTSTTNDLSTQRGVRSKESGRCDSSQAPRRHRSAVEIALPSGPNQAVKAIKCTLGGLRAVCVSAASSAV